MPKILSFLRPNYKPKPFLKVHTDAETLDHCAICFEGGDLVCCDVCPRSYHSRCMKVQTEQIPDKWQCHACDNEAREYFKGDAWENSPRVKAKPGTERVALFHRWVMAKDLAYDFNLPVDWKKYGLNDYPKLVKCPLDFGSIQEMLKEGAFDCPKTGLLLYVQCMRLVFFNCSIYNMERTAIARSAEVLSLLFERFYLIHLRPVIPHIARQAALFSLQYLRTTQDVKSFLKFPEFVEKTKEEYLLESENFPEVLSDLQAPILIRKVESKKYKDLHKSPQRPTEAFIKASMKEKTPKSAKKKLINGPSTKPPPQSELVFCEFCNKSYQQRGIATHRKTCFKKQGRPEGKIKKPEESKKRARPSSGSGSKRPKIEEPTKTQPSIESKTVKPASELPVSPSKAKRSESKDRHKNEDKGGGTPDKPPKDNDLPLTEKASPAKKSLNSTDKVVKNEAKSDSTKEKDLAVVTKSDKEALMALLGENLSSPERKRRSAPPSPEVTNEAASTNTKKKRVSFASELEVKESVKESHPKDSKKKDTRNEPTPKKQPASAKVKKQPVRTTPSRSTKSKSGSEKTSASKDKEKPSASKNEKASAKPHPKILIGKTKIKKEFPPDGFFTGTVKKWDPPYYQVVYEDGDKEELEEAEILPLLEKQASPKKKTPLKKKR